MTLRQAARKPCRIFAYAGGVRSHQAPGGPGLWPVGVTGAQDGLSSHCRGNEQPLLRRSAAQVSYTCECALAAARRSAGRAGQGAGRGSPPRRILMSPLMLTLAAELTDAEEDGDAASLAAIAWRLF